jgi:lysozyme family protein
MTPPRSQAEIVPTALFVSALLTAGLAVAIWIGLLDVGDSRSPLTAVLALVVVIDVGIGLFFRSRAKS